MGRKWTLLATLLVASLVSLDFIGFCQRAAKLEAPTNATADAVIALTGGSGLRIAQALELVEAGAAPKMLISGVHPDVTAEEMANIAGGDAGTYECCVDFGYVAETTVGNAQESAEWVAANGYENIILVTSDYHMARSLLLLGKAMPETNLIPYSVRTNINPSAPFGDMRSLRGLVWEWLKWRVTNLRWGGA
ncbi:MAG: YdcF family protein [Pseudomonadota bacterium]